MWAATAATVIAAGASTYSSISSAQAAKKAASGGGGATLANPSAQWTGNLYGMKWDPKRGYVSSGAPSIFGGNERTYLSDLMTPHPIYQGANDAATQGMDMGMAAMPGAVAGIGTGMDWLKGLADAGPTSIDPIIAQRKYDLFNNTLPQMAEQYSGLGSTGLFSSDWQGAGVRTAGQMEVDLGLKQYDATEAYKNRLQQIAPAYGTMATAGASVPVTLGSDILNLGTNQRTANYNALPGNDVMRVMAALSEQGSPGNTGFYQPGYNPTSSTAGLMSGLGQVLPGVLNAVGSYYGGGGAGAGSGAGSSPGGYYAPGASGFSSAQILKR